MTEAWLNSLSEDWPSDLIPDGSPPPDLQSLSNSKSSQRPASTRIPKYNPQNQAWIIPLNGDSSALGERSSNENNIPASQRSTRRPSKLREVTNGTRGRHMSRTVSTSTTFSTQCHTVQHKSHSLSPKKSTREAPEWKRRLLHGEVAYGEQCDLFSPAGLENMFRPPVPQTASPLKLTQKTREDSVMPSSPPVYKSRQYIMQEESHRSNGEDAAEEEQRKNQQPKGIQYKMTEPGSDFTADDISRSSTFRPTAPIFVPNCRGFPFSDGSSMPNSSLLNVDDGRDRIASGQSDIRNEGLSPIYVTRQHASSKGVINQPAPALQADELKRRLEDIREDSVEISVGEDLEFPIPLPVDTTEESEDYAHNGNFINSRRGGYSEENSFRQQMLSPSSAIDESAMLPEHSMQASTPKEVSVIKKTRASNEFHETPIPEESIVEPQTPQLSPRKVAEKEQQSSSGSPLKLFGAYDTFTNQKLLRRLSQFEEALDKRVDNGTSVSEGPKSINPRLNNGSTSSSNAYQLPRKVRKFQSFGEGDLDSFQFNNSYGSSGSDGIEEDEKDVSLPRLSPQGRPRFQFQLKPSPALKDKVFVQRPSSVTKQVVNAQRARPWTSSSSSPELPTTQRQEDLQTPRKRNGNSDGKRLQKTPLRDPTPKRRRTLHSSELQFEEVSHENVELETLKETHQQMQFMIDTRSKDARRYGEGQQTTNVAVLAMRQILRPRTPTPSQRSSEQSSRSSLSGIQLELDDRVRMQQKKLAQIQAELDSTDHLRTVTSQQNGARKGSVTTQDFLDEAKKIMAGIRGKVRTQSGLASLEESESEHDRNQSINTEAQDDEAEDSYQESTLEPFSRPPSREGGPLTRLPLTQENPDLLDHLRKYQEMSDIDGFVASSVRSMAMAKEALVAAQDLDRSIEQTISREKSQSTLSNSSISDPPNVRISENPEAIRKRKHSSSSGRTGDDSNNADFPTQRSDSSGGQSTMQSIPTRSSRGSESRRVIAPHTVSHLIPEQLAGMVFDRERNIWVKRRSSGEGQNFLPSDETEEDPFENIPDLSVDKTQELQRVKAVAAKRMEEARVEQLEIERGNPSKQDPIGQYDLRKMPIEIPQIIIDESTVMENVPQATPGCHLPKAVTDIASLEKEQASTVIESVIRRTTTHTDTRDEVVEEVEREISIHEGWILNTPLKQRRVTITFSSSLESSPPYHEHDNSYLSEAQDESEFGSALLDEASNGSDIITKHSASEKSSSTRMKSALKSSSLRASVPGHTFSCRPVSRIEERDEESYHEHPEDQRRRSVSNIVAKPMVSRRISSLILATPRPSHEIGTLTLTPMSDFTVHQKDETFGLDVSYVAQNQRYVMGASAKKTMSLSIKHLVESITSVEPYEPYWENMKELSLREKRLTNLHKLDEFCTEVEDLDVSHNQVSQLDGVPQTVRHLQITHNILSDLTAWGHLQNLQYVDVSNNDLDSLSAFSSLIHLRSLRADNNKIRSLNGVDRLDGLLSLRLRGNSVQTLDFSGTGLQRLTDLDLKDNHVSSVEHLEELRSLSSLNLVDNHLCEFAVEDTEIIWSLKYLKLSGNNLESIDVSNFPNLRLLYLDQNRLGIVTGILKTKHLDSLSMREQHEDCVIDHSFLAEAFEVRKLFLSGNMLGSFLPTTDFLNLQYLELASCGLESLPEGFGYLVANTRVLNLNYNALVDLSPLEGIVRLKKLHVAGNRLRFLKGTARGLSLVPTIALADLRGNPLTVGFYPPVLETASGLLDDAETEKRVTEPYTLVEADPAKMAKYATCLDMQTKMLKRTYEMLVMTSCRRLLVLDGLKVDRAAIKTKDKVWQELVHMGVFNAKAFGSETGDIKEAKEEVREREQSQPVENPVEEEMWHAEDSFA